MPKNTRDILETGPFVELSDDEGAHLTLSDDGDDLEFVGVILVVKLERRLTVSGKEYAEFTCMKSSRLKIQDDTVEKMLERQGWRVLKAPAHQLDFYTL